MAAIRSAVALGRISMATPSSVRGLATGSVKWFNLTKGFGFITPDEQGSPDIFAHQSAIQATGFRYLKEGAKVNYEVSKTEKGVSAVNITDENGKPFDTASERAQRAPRPAGERPSRGPRGPRREGGSRDSQ